LIVDDDRAVLFVLYNALMRGQTEYDVATASSGAQALERFAGDGYQLLITDVRMPGMDGISLTEAVRDLSADVAVIWVTGYGCDEARPDAVRLNVYRCLETPLDIGEFRRAVADVFDEADEQRSASARSTSWQRGG
jgi:DNA-binding NtrC family response regulator